MYVLDLLKVLLVLGIVYLALSILTKFKEYRLLKKSFSLKRKSKKDEVDVDD